MVNKGVPRKLWEYIVSWVSEVMPIHCSSESSVNEGISLTNVTSNTVDISEYLDVFLMTKYFSRIVLVYLLVNMGGD